MPDQDKQPKEEQVNLPPEVQTPEELRPLNRQQELFCQEYIKTRNQTQAYVNAKYSPIGARMNASALMTQHNVRHRVNELIKEQLDVLKIDARFVLRQILNSAKVNLTDAYDENGCFKPLSEMSEALQLSIISIESEEIYDWEGEGKDKKRVVIGYTKKIKLESKQKALEMLGRNLKLFTDVMKLEGLDDLAEQIKEARERADSVEQDPNKRFNPN